MDLKVQKSALFTIYSSARVSKRGSVHVRRWTGLLQMSRPLPNPQQIKHSSGCSKTERHSHATIIQG